MTRFIILLIILPLTAAIYLYWTSNISIVSSQDLNKEQPQVQNPTVITPQATPAPQDEDTFITSMVASLKQKHGHEIQNLVIQASMQDFRDFVLEQYPVNGEQIFTRIMQLAFPEYATAILDLVAKLDQYNEWYAQNLLNLNDMDILSRKGAIWNKRREIFGDLADVLWQQELSSAEEKRQTVQQTIDALNTANDMALSERLFILQQTINEQFEEEQQGYLMNKGLVADVYFRLDSVQQDLKNMSPEQRAETLARSRKQLGFSEDDIALLAQEDAEKEQRWQTGHEYMTARDQLQQSYTGEVLETKLNALREQYFKKSASTIAAEEKSGFFRYNRPRLYGSN